MFGTLVVTLPSAHRGGELRIRHAGREVTVDTSAIEFSEVSYVAFYADCEHEAMPVQEGNRVCLVYNLIQKRGRNKSSTLKAPEYETQVGQAATILDEFLKAPAAPAKIAWLLEHQYSPAGLSFSALKAADAAKAGVLGRAAARAECVVHLGIVHIGESGAADPEYAGYSYRPRWDRYRDEDDEESEEGEDEEDANFTAVTVDDGWRYVDEWRDTGGVAVEFGPIPLADDELLPGGALNGEPPDRKKLTEASGNEGASYERSYHRAALVLWRRERYSEVLLQAGVVAALPYLKQLATGGKQARPEANSLAKRMVDAWAGDSRRGDGDSPGGNRPGPAHRIDMMTTLGKLGNGALLGKFIADTVTPRYDGSENAVLLSSVGVLGDAQAGAVLSALISARMRSRPNECAEFLLLLSGDPSHCFPEVGESAVAALDGIGARDAKQEGLGWEPAERRPSLIPQFLENLMKALRRFKTGLLCETAAEKVAARPEAFSPVAVVVPALEQIHASLGLEATASDSSTVHLWICSAEFLLQRSEVPPEPPLNWQLDVKLSCSCPDCRELQAFVLNPIERVHRFRVKKERRQHLHDAINKNRLDMTHVTERVGSPQTLVCTKDRRTFDRRMKEYRQEIAAMRTLVGLAPPSDAANGLSTRMQAAVKLV
jgi:hypothetical protein